MTTGYVGIDCGGTQMRAWLADVDGHVLSRSQQGAGNALRVPVATLVERLQALLDTLFAESSVPFDRNIACIGWAGSGSPRGQRICQEVIQHLKMPSIQKCILKTDAEVALSGAFLQGPGILLICGTGSICFARDSGGLLHRTGGWGPEFDDSGSGAWLGQQALRRAIQQADDRLPTGPLMNLVFQALNLNDLSSLPAHIAAQNFSPHQMAALCPIVLEAAQADPIAQALCAEATAEQAKLIVATHHKAAVDHYSLTGGGDNSRPRKPKGAPKRK